MSACRECGKPISGRTTKQFCSRKCQSASWYRRRKVEEEGTPPIRELLGRLDAAGEWPATGLGEGSDRERAHQEFWRDGRRLTGAPRACRCSTGGYEMHDGEARCLSCGGPVYGLGDGSVREASAVVVGSGKEATRRGDLLREMTTDGHGQMLGTAPQRRQPPAPVHTRGAQRPKREARPYGLKTAATLEAIRKSYGTDEATCRALLGELRVTLNGSFDATVERELPFSPGEARTLIGDRS